MFRYSLENGTEAAMEVRIGGRAESEVVRASGADVRRIHGINPSVTWETSEPAVNVQVRYVDAYPGAPPKVFTMLPGTVTLLCPTPFGDVCPPLRLSYVVRQAL
jgi:hypothetical protein